MENKKTNAQLMYQLEGRPSLLVAFPLGMQHVLAMFTSNLAPILIIAGVCGLAGSDTVIMVQCAMFVSGLTTFIQLYPIKIGKNIRIGGNLPIVMGTSFAFVPSAITVANAGGIGRVLASSLLGSIVEVIIGFYYKYLHRFFPPVVIGCMLVTVGCSLIEVGVDYFAGGVGSPDYGSTKNLLVAFLSLFIILILQIVGKGILKSSAILIGLVVGYIVSFFLGMIDTTTIKEAAWFSVPIPMHFKLDFDLGSILNFAVLFIASGLETIGNTSGITIAAFDREATKEETSGAILADALGSTTAAVFNCLPNTAFGQNAGIVAMTKVVNKFCVATGAFVLCLSGFIPKLGAIFSVIPNPVLGGSIITVFAMILINGLKLLGKAGFNERNILIMGITFALGLGIANNPESVQGLPSVLRFVLKDAVVATCIVAIVANIIIPSPKENTNTAE